MSETSELTLEAEEKEMFKKCQARGLIPISGLQTNPEEGGKVGHFLLNPTLSYLRMITRDPFPFLGGATKAEQKRWTEEEREHAELYELIQRDFSGKKRRNVDMIVEYLKGMLDDKLVGFLGTPILWFQQEDIDVSRHYFCVRRDAYPHVIDGSTRIAAIHRLWQGEPTYRAKMEKFKMPILCIYGEEVDEEIAAQIFCDVNWKAIPVDPSTAKALDQRDIHVELAKVVERSSSLLQGRVSPRRQLSASDTALITKYAIYQMLRCFTDGTGALAKEFESAVLTPATEAEVTAKATDFIKALEGIFGEQWREEGARDRYLHLQAPVLKAIAAFAHAAYFPESDSAKKAVALKFLGSIDWSRSNAAWVGIATRQGKNGFNILNNDPAVREMASLLTEKSSKLPRRMPAAVS